MATTTPNYGWTVPTSTDLVKDGATAIETLGDAIDASMNTALGTKKAGMVLLNTTSFSGVSSQSFNDVFSATYDTYVIRGSYTGTADSSCDIRLRVSGADNSAANYERQLMNVSNTTTSFLRLTGQTTWVNAFNHITTGNGINIFEIQRPFATAPTWAITMGGTESGTGDVRAVNQYYKHTASTSFTGFSILVNSGTITGSMSVYGYNK